MLPPSEPPPFPTFTPVTEDDVCKIIHDSPTKSCLIDPWSTFLVKENIDKLFRCKLVNYSLPEGLVPEGFKNAVVTPLIT